MERPQYTISPPNTANLKVTAPPGWFVTISAISRESYSHIISITDDVVPGESNTTYLGSQFGQPPTPMKDLRHSFDSVAITAQPKQISLDLRFYHTNDKSLSRNLIKAAVPNNSCAAISVHEVDKPETAPVTIPNYVILMIFIDDGKDRTGPNRGMDNNAIATIHLLKKTPKEGAQSDDEDEDDEEDDDD